jgi:hypothetical protein
MVTRRAFPLNELNMPKGDGTVSGLRKLIDFLDVQRSRRYIRTSTSTFCNIYAYDYAYLNGAFLPRVWWTDSALLELKFENPQYGKNLREMSANDLYDWFYKYGAEFGWKEISTTEAQIAANNGKCVILVAANRNRKKSGHIVAVVPETNEVKCVGANGVIIYPVMSQAGSVNKKYFCDKWWDGHDRPRIFVHEK